MGNSDTQFLVETGFSNHKTYRRTEDISS